MTWSLNVGGHTPTPEGESDWRRVEHELVAELHRVLSDPKYGTSSSNFAGNYVVGEIHKTNPILVTGEHGPELATLPTGSTVVAEDSGAAPFGTESDPGT